MDNNKNYKKKKKNNIHKEKPKVSSIDLHEKRIIYLDGEIVDKTAKETIELMLKMDEVNHKDITLYINSGGGSVSAGLAIYDVMNMIKSDVKTIVLGKAASMACILLLNGKKGKRYCLANSEVMIHEVSSGTFGKVAEMQEHLDHSKSLNTKLRKIIVQKTNLNWKQVKEDTTKKDRWYTAKEAVKYGFVDKIL